MAAYCEDHVFREGFKGNEPLQSLLPQLPQHLAMAYKPKKLAVSLEDEIAQKVSIYHGGIVDDELCQDVDAVVNPANERLWCHGSGVCGVLFQAAGYHLLQRACNLVTTNTFGNRVPTGQTAITKAFGLNDIDWILHTVAPCYVIYIYLFIYTPYQMYWSFYHCNHKKTKQNKKAR